MGLSLDRRNLRFNAFLRAGLGLSAGLSGGRTPLKKPAGFRGALPGASFYLPTIVAKSRHPHDSHLHDDPFVSIPHNREC